MIGLIKNNFYASLSNIKFFLTAMVLLGIFVITVDNAIPSLLIGYMLLSMVGFPIISISSLRKETASKWEKYKLTAPIRRIDIVKSYFTSQLIWLSIGIIFAAVCVSLSISLHGFPFDKNTDILMLFTVGISISLLMNAIFFPLIYLSHDEKNEAILVISLLCAIGIIMALTSLLNWFFGPKMSTSQLLLSATILVLFAIVIFVLSFLLTVRIFKRKEY